MERVLEQANNIIQNVSQTIGQVADTALEYGLRVILPDFIEEDVIEIKDKFIQEGFISGVQEAVDKLEDVGKSIKGIFTGEFETIEQVKRVIENGGLLDEVSELIDKILKKLLSKKLINKSTSTLIKQGKKQILNSLEEEIEGIYKPTTYNLDKLIQNCNEWKEKYKENNYSEMEKTMKKITQNLKQIQAVEETINKARNIEKIQEYIKEKGSVEELTESEKKLLEKIK